MRQLITLGLAFYSFFLIKMNIPRLPARIPTHFNAAGEADGWGSPDTLWFLLVAQVLTCGLFLVAPLLGRRFPGAVNLGFRKLSDFTPAQRERIMPFLTDMMGYMSVLLSLLFCILTTRDDRSCLVLPSPLRPLVGVRALPCWHCRDPHLLPSPHLRGDT
jgi:uncharacterized membrane protein